MNTLADKTQENKSQSVANEVSQKQSGAESVFQYVDNRLETVAQRNLQEMSNNSPQVKYAAQLQAMADSYSSGQQHPVQKKENNTGLPDNLKSGMENLSGYAMDDVKIHYNSDKPAQLKAHAYAQGTDIHLASGQEKHLAHEAWHVVQQKQGRVKPTLQYKGADVSDDKGLEKEADQMADRINHSQSHVNSPDLNKQKSTGNGVIQYAVDENVQKAFGERFKDKDLFKYKDFKIWYSQRISSEDYAGLKKVSDASVIGRFDQFQTYVTFGADLNYEQTEQVLALSKGILSQVREVFENDLIVYLRKNYQGPIVAVNQHYEEPKEKPLVSKRDQSKEFFHKEKIMNVSSLNKLFGGSINSDDIRSEDSISGFDEMNTFEKDGIAEDSAYAESNRKDNNFVSAGIDTSDRLGMVMAKFLSSNPEINPNNKKEDLLLAFFYILKKKENKTLYETVQSLSGTLDFPYTRGIELYNNLSPKTMNALGWQVYPSYFEYPEFLSLLSRNLFTKEPKDSAAIEKMVPKPIWEIITKNFTALNSPGKLIYNKNLDPKSSSSSGSVLDNVPKVIQGEISTEERETIEGITDQDKFDKAWEEYYYKINVPAYLALMMAHSKTYTPKYANWFSQLQDVLTPPEMRKDKLGAPNALKGRDKALIKNAEEISKFLGSYDYGFSVKDKEESTKELIEKDPNGADAISKYISGDFGKYSDTLDKPGLQVVVDVDVNDIRKKNQGINSVSGAVRGLEGLPIFNGWTYRLEADQNNHAIGEILSPGVLWSSALAPKFAGQFDRSGKGTVYMIQSIFTGRDVQLLAGTTKWYQREILFPPYARFVIENKTVKGEQMVYTVKEISPAGKPGDFIDLSQSIPTRRAEEERELRTLIDKPHYEKAREKYEKQEAWTSEEAFQAGIENLGSGIHDPKEIYGLKTFKNWQNLLHTKITHENIANFWSVKGFMGIAEGLTGEPQLLRDGWSGWGGGVYNLADDEANNLAFKGLRLLCITQTGPDWAKILSSQGKFDLFDFGTKVEGQLFCNRIKPNAELNTWRQNIVILENLGLLAKASPREYTVTYGLNKSGEIQIALEEMMVRFSKEFESLKSGLSGEKYNEKVTRLAAQLQQSIVAIHPFMNGNGRIARMYMYKVLEYYLDNKSEKLDHLPVIDNTGRDLSTSGEDWGKMLWEKVSKGPSSKTKGLGFISGFDLSKKSENWEGLIRKQQINSGLIQSLAQSIREVSDQDDEHDERADHSKPASSFVYAILDQSSPKKKREKSSAKKESPKKEVLKRKSSFDFDHGSKNPAKITVQKSWFDVILNIGGGDCLLHALEGRNLDFESVLSLRDSLATSAGNTLPDYLSGNNIYQSLFQSGIFPQSQLDNLMRHKHQIPKSVYQNAIKIPGLYAGEAEINAYCGIAGKPNEVFIVTSDGEIRRANAQGAITIADINTLESISPGQGVDQFKQRVKGLIGSKLVLFQSPNHWEQIISVKIDAPSLERSKSTLDPSPLRLEPSYVDQTILGYLGALQNAKSEEQRETVASEMEILLDDMSDFELQKKARSIVNYILK